MPGVCLCHKEIDRFPSSSTAPKSEILGRSCEEAAEAETVRELAGLWQALSPRECQVAQLAAEGLTTKAVSDVLGIAERTAQVRVAHVCSKLGVENAVGVAQIIARLRARGVLQ